MTKEISPRFVEFSKPFIEAARNVFETMVYTKIQTGKPELKDTKVSKGDVSAIMGLTGTVEIDGEQREFKGMLVCSYPYETYVKVSSAMLMSEYTEYNDEIADVGAEISNIITGNAKRDLNVKGYNIGMAVPTTISGPGHNIKYPDKTYVVLIPITCDHGPFFIELCFND